MHQWRLAAVVAFVSSIATAAIVVDCDYRTVARSMRLTVNEAADSFEVRVQDSDGIALTQSLLFGVRGEFVALTMMLPKSDKLCGSQGNPTAEVWCQSNPVPVVLTRANGQTVETELESGGLDLAIEGGATPRRVAYRVFGSRVYDLVNTVSASQNGAFAGPICKR